MKLIKTILNGIKKQGEFNLFMENALRNGVKFNLEALTWI